MECQHPDLPRPKGSPGHATCSANACAVLGTPEWLVTYDSATSCKGICLDQARLTRPVTQEASVRASGSAKVREPGFGRARGA